MTGWLEVSCRECKSWARPQPSMRHLMDHHERQGEIGLGIDAQAILLALVGLDTVGHACFLCSPSQQVEPLLLEIDGDDEAAVLNEVRHHN